MELPLWIRGLRAMLALLAGGVVLFALLRFGGVRAHDLAWIQMGVAGMTLIWGVLLLAGRVSRPGCGVRWLFLLALSYGWFRVATAGWDYTARQEFAHFGMLALFFLALGGVLADARAQRIVVAFLITLATAVALYAVMQFFLKSDRIMEVVQPSGYRGRASGTLVNPNHGAFLMSAGLVMALPLALLGRGSPTGKIFLGYAVLACAGGVVVTFSRGAWLGCAAALLFVAIWMAWREKPRWLGVGLLAFLLLGGLVVGERASAKIRAQGRQHLLDVRFTAIWPAAIKIWQEEPVLGAGPGRFTDEFRRFRPAQYNMQSEPQRAHNDYLNILADWGGVGGALLLGLLGVIGFALYRRFGDTTSPADAGRSNRRALAVALTAAGVYVLVHEGSDFHLYIPVNALVMATLCALVVAPVGGSIIENSPARSVSVGPRIIWGLFALVAAGVLLAHTVPARAEARHLWAARSGSQSSEVVLSHLVKAWWVRPDNPDTVFQIGELMRQSSSAGNAGYEAEGLAALAWLRRAVALNPRQPHYWIALGRTQHWLDYGEEARKSFKTALLLDPNNYRTQAFYGWFLFEQGEYVEAYRWLKRSQWLNFEANTLARFYLPRLESRLVAAGQWPVPGHAELKYRNPQFGNNDLPP